MDLTIKGTKESCDFDWELSDSFPAGKELSQLTLLVNVYCSLSEGAQTFVLRIHNTEYLQDSSGNDLATNLLTAKSKKFAYISATEAAVLSGMGAAFSTASLATFLLALAMCLFQTVAVSSFWSFVNMLQILSYLPIINCNIPYNFEVFITQYLTMSQITFPTELMPDWMPNPLAYFESFITEALNERYSLCGYDSLSFVYNFGNQIFTWLLLLLFYILLRILTWMIPKSKYGLILIR